MKLRSVDMIALALVCTVPATFKAADTIQIKGQLLGFDGKPMPAGCVYLNRPGIKSLKADADADGHFSVAAEKEGVYWLWAAGVHHKTLLIPILADGTQKIIDITIRLATADYVAPIEKVIVIGDFNKFSEKSGGVEMQRQSDGTFVATIESPLDALRYQLQGVQADDFPICGTQADSFEKNKDNPLIADRSFLYDSVIKAGGHPVRIVFDPNKLPRSQSDADIRFGDADSTPARIVAADRDLRKGVVRYQKSQKAYLAEGKDPKKFQYDFSSDLRTLEQRIEDQHDPLVRQFLMLRYFDFREAENNSSMAQRAFKEIPPASLAWSLLWAAGPINAFASISKAANQPETEEDYRQQVLATHPDDNVRAGFLFAALRKAHLQGEADKVGRYYTRLMDEFGKTDYARMAAEIAPNRNILKGKPVPDFKLISLDDSAEDVAKFRKSKWPRPWLNARLEDGFGGKVATSFEVVGIPKAILVGKDGQIIAYGEELRGDKLDGTIARAIGEIKAK